jgi:hypothetical protein
LISAGFEKIDEDEYSNGKASIYLNSANSVGIFGDADWCEIVIPEVSVTYEGREVLTTTLKAIGLWNSRSGVV